VTDPYTPLAPYRISHIDVPKWVANTGYHPADIARMLTAFNESIATSNIAIDLRVVSANKFRYSSMCPHESKAR
jgi:hypothetical protein